ncbi:MAG: hypothetical protein BGN88_04685 [Clostridiales bacterium 43-6]|nr:MAG: hypothetical protein BGN88_04685 [Clostridiales bacterium 43-6]
MKMLAKRILGIVFVLALLAGSVIYAGAETTTTAPYTSPFLTGGGYLWGLPQSGVPSFLSSFTTQSGVTVEAHKNNTKVTTGLLGTGTVAKINRDGSTIEQYTILYFGDVDGDGAINAIDLLKIKKHILGKKTLKNEFLQAADTDRNGTTADVLDLYKLKQHLLKITTIYQK